jgi:hypothetical protein
LDDKLEKDEKFESEKSEIEIKEKSESGIKEVINDVEVHI